MKDEKEAARGWLGNLISGVVLLVVAALLGQVHRLPPLPDLPARPAWLDWPGWPRWLDWPRWPTWTSAQPGPGDSFNPQALREARERIRPLHPLKPAARPGEWLSTHDEPNQRPREYRATSPNRPGDRRHWICLVAMGDLERTHPDIPDATAELLHIFFNTSVKWLDPIDPGSLPSDARRVHPTWHDPQLATSSIRDAIRERRPEDAVALIALTEEDLWPGVEEMNFAFVHEFPGGLLGALSLHRLGDPRRESATCLRRTLKSALHLTGHLLGMAHCRTHPCAMNGCNHRKELDEQPVGFCPDCESKVWWACRADPETRYERLARFAEAHGLDEEARNWRSALEALRGGPPQSSP